MGCGGKFSAAVLSFALLAGALGCKSSEIDLHPVKGQVTFDGKPPEGATVTLRPVAGSKAPIDLFPTGAVQADGSFTLMTYPHGDGAPEGDYVAVLMWYPPNASEIANPQSQLPAKYSSEATSGLPVTIKPGSNELAPFVLTK
jgi:hypothetical protein